MTSALNQVIKFYRDAYQFEYNTEKVTNFFGKGGSHWWYPSTFKLLSQPDFELPVDTAWGEDVAAELELNGGEKKLVCGTFFVKGKTMVLGKPQKLFAPLYLQDVQLLLEKGVYRIRLDTSSLTVNPTVVTYLNGLDEDINHQYDDLSVALLSKENPFNFEGLVNTVKHLKVYYPQLDISLLDRRLEYNEQLSDLEAVYASRKAGFLNLLFPDAAIGLVDKPKGSRGVINELSALSEEVVDASLLQTVFGQVENNTRSPQKSKKSASDSIVPVSLSEQQEKIIQAAKEEQRTLVIGPPGTGKSYTIAALAIQAAHDGKKVLIASKSEQACQVIHRKIQRDIGVKYMSVDASKARYKISVAGRLRRIANGVGSRFVKTEDLKRLRQQVQILQGGINRQVKTIQKRAAEEVKWGRVLMKNQDSWYTRFRSGIIRLRYFARPDPWQLQVDLQRYDQELYQKEKRLIKLTHNQRLSRLLKSQRGELLKLTEAFEEKRSNVIQEIFSEVDYGTILRALPIWICKSSNISEALPLEKELFDLVIIDEASQCDIASSIPLLYRAKSAVVVGDPNQLRHVSFLSRRKEAQIRDKYALDDLSIRFRDQSILDLVNSKINSQDHVVFLDEHFRSMPDIISFSNRHFYDNALKIMTRTPHTEGLQHLLLIPIEGKRENDGSNPVEAAAVISSIEEIVAKERDLDKKTASRIGVLSPFRGQVNLLKKLIKARIGPELISKHEILLGTPHLFQGEEKDIMLLSFVVDNDTHGMTIRYLERPDVFNVSITRARHYQKVYYSINPNLLASDSLLANYLSQGMFQRPVASPDLVTDEFTAEVGRYLTELKLGRVETGVSVAGVELDLVLVTNGEIVGVDLVGYPGAFSDQLSVQQIRSLERAGVKTFVLPYSVWCFEKQKVQRALRKFIEKMMVNS